MFTVNGKYECPDYEYIDLIVHCALKSYRRLKGSDPDDWEVRRDSGEWEVEYCLGEIINDCWLTKPLLYSWTQDA